MKPLFMSFIAFFSLMAAFPTYADARENEVSSEEQSLIDAFSDAPRTGQRDEHGNITTLGEDPDKREGVDLERDRKEKEAKTKIREKTRKNAKRAEKAAYDKMILNEMLQEEKDRANQRAISQKKLLDKQKEAATLNRDAMEQRKTLFTGKDFQDKLNKINSKFKAEKKRLDDKIARKKKAERAARERKVKAQAQAKKQKTKAYPCKNNFTMQRLDKFVCNCPGYVFDVKRVSCIPGQKTGVMTGKDADLVKGKRQGIADDKIMDVGKAQGIADDQIIDSGKRQGIAGDQSKGLVTGKKKGFIDDFTKGQDLLPPGKRRKVFIDDFTKGQDLVPPARQETVDKNLKVNNGRQETVDEDLQILDGVRGAVDKTLDIINRVD